MECLFCKIVTGEMPSNKVHEDEFTYAFFDIHPQAPKHILIISKKHIPSLLHLAPEDRDVLGQMHAAALEVARAQNLAQGFRTVINTGQDGGQTVDHLHLHLLGGRAMHWPPG